MKCSLTICLFWIFTLVVRSTKANQDFLFFSPEIKKNYLQEYNKEEKSKIEQDLVEIWEKSFSQNCKSRLKKPIYLSTAGAPGSRKTTILERFIHHYVLDSQLIYIDPDRKTLTSMNSTYKKSTSDFDDLKTLQAAYEKWRGASNYIAIYLLEKAFSQRQNVAHGSTSTGHNIDSFLSRVRQNGYEIILLLCFATDDFRKSAVEHRNFEEKFYQSSPEDESTKANLFITKMKSYFNYADSLYLFWSDDLSKQELLAATLTKGCLNILNEKAYKLLVELFEKNRTILQSKENPLLSWDQLIKTYQIRS